MIDPSESYINHNGQFCEFNWRYRAICPDGTVCLFTDRPVPALYPGTDGPELEWLFDGHMKPTGEMMLPIGWEDSVVKL